MVTMATPVAEIQPMKGSAGFNPLNITPEAFDRRFSDATHILERKYDGLRVLVKKQGQYVDVSIVKDFPDYIRAAFRELPDGIYDGELAAGDNTHSWDAMTKDTPKVFYVFDALIIQGVDLTDVGLEYRQDALRIALSFHTGMLIRLRETLPCRWASVQRIWDGGGEGAILKRKGSKYQCGRRSGEWAKVKKIEQHVVTITGFQPGSFGPCAIMQYRFDDGIPGTLKNKNHAWLRDMEKNPQAWVGRRVLIECQLRGTNGKPRHAMVKKFVVDHPLETGEVVR